MGGGGMFYFSWMRQIWPGIPARLRTNGQNPQTNPLTISQPFILNEKDAHVHWRWSGAAAEAHERICFAGSPEGTA